MQISAIGDIAFQRPFIDSRITCIGIVTGKRDSSRTFLGEISGAGNIIVHLEGIGTVDNKTTIIGYGTIDTTGSTAVAQLQDAVGNGRITGIGIVIGQDQGLTADLFETADIGVIYDTSELAGLDGEIRGVGKRPAAGKGPNFDITAFTVKRGPHRDVEVITGNVSVPGVTGGGTGVASAESRTRSVSTVRVSPVRRVATVEPIWIVPVPSLMLSAVSVLPEATCRIVIVLPAASDVPPDMPTFRVLSLISASPVTMRRGTVGAAELMKVRVALVATRSPS